MIQKLTKPGEDDDEEEMLKNNAYSMMNKKSKKNFWKNLALYAKEIGWLGGIICIVFTARWASFRLVPITDLFGRKR